MCLVNLWRVHAFRKLTAEPELTTFAPPNWKITCSLAAFSKISGGNFSAQSADSVFLWLSHHTGTKCQKYASQQAKIRHRRAYSYTFCCLRDWEGNSGINNVCFRGFKWCLCREMAAQRKYLFVVMPPLIDFLATPFLRRNSKGLVQHC